MFWATNVLLPFETVRHNAKLSLDRANALTKQAEQELVTNNGCRQQQLTWDDILLEFKQLLRNEEESCEPKDSNVSTKRSTQRRRATSDAIRGLTGDQRHQFETKRQQLLEWTQRASHDLITTLHEILQELESHLGALQEQPVHEEGASGETKNVRTEEGEAFARQAHEHFMKAVKQVNSEFGRIIWMTGHVGKAWEETREVAVCRTVNAEQKAVETVLSHWAARKMTESTATGAFQDAQRDILKAWRTAAAEIKPTMYQSEYWADAYYYSLQKFNDWLATTKHTWHSQILGCSCG